MGKGPQDLVEKFKVWDKNMRKTYSDSCELAVKLFGNKPGFSLLVEPKGAFFAVVSGRFLMGKKVPQAVTLLDGRIVTDLPAKVGENVFSKDLSIAYFLVYAAEVVTVPASGFDFEAGKGALRVSLAVSPELLTEASMRMENAAKFVFEANSEIPHA